MEPGTLISGKYRLLRQLGKGGMGSVWAARNELTDRDFAVKFLLPDLATNKEALSRFFLEARACGQIKHPAVVEVYDMGQADDASPFLVMELLEGEGFDQRLHREGVFAPADAAIWLAFVARGLAEAHERGLVHRDLKPGNVFFTIDPRSGDVVPKLLDFGVSKAVGIRSGDDFVKTTTGAVLGSPAYMSPEQAKGETDIDGRSDVWSLGVILYEALTGRIPFDAPNYNALMLSIITKEHDQVSTLMPGVPPMLSEVVDLALMKDRSKRIQTAIALAERLEAVAAALTGGAPAGVMDRAFLKASPRSLPPPRQFSTTEGTWSGRRAGTGKRSPIVYGATTVVLGALVLGGIAAFLRMRGPVVAVAGRSELALTTGLARLKVELERARVEEKAAAQAADATAHPRSESSTQPAKAQPIDAASLPTSAPATPRGGSAPVRKPKKSGGKDPHGGVDSAGF